MRTHINLTIAEACGWRRINTSPVNITLWVCKHYYCCNSDTCRGHDEPPDFYYDMTATNAAAKIILDNPVKVAKYYEMVKTENKQSRKGPWFETDIILADAPERATALYKFIQGKD